jgi:hypothetical protein
VGYTFILKAYCVIVGMTEFERYALSLKIYRSIVGMTEEGGLFINKYLHER